MYFFPRDVCTPLSWGMDYRIPAVLVLTVALRDGVDHCIPLVLGFGGFFLYSRGGAGGKRGGWFFFPSLRITRPTIILLCYKYFSPQY